LRIVIGGDLCPTGPIGRACRDGDAAGVFGDLVDELQNADLAVLNLECPLITQPSPIAKSGPVLGTTPDHIAVLPAAGFDLVSLANNHAMDHGATGLASTIAACDRAGLASFGAGQDLDAAGQIRIRELAGCRVAFLGMAEHEFGIAQPRRAGVNPLDPMSFVRLVRRRAHDWDFLIVLLHGGNEFYPYPRPSLMDACRFLVEQGAHAVICQHTHCAGCYETYQGRHIVYGQGNLLFDSADASRSWYEGVLVVLEVDASSASRLRLVPICQSRPAPGVRSMPEPRATQFMAEIEERSARLGDAAFVQREWDGFCEQQREYYLRRLGSPNRAFRALDRLTRYTRFFYSRAPLRAEHLNLVRCESHREVLINILSRGLL
jgi:poly-gamma-glutamate capsule biosynthesis protein CapA/YwtB (metallophosphatase superfamily)